MKRILRYVSDIHLEMFRESTGGDQLQKIEGLFKFEREADTRYFLAIPGDIGTVETLGKLFEKVSPVYERIFYVPGNHEYYNKSSKKDYIQTMDEIANKLQQLCQSYTNIVYLDNNIFELDEYRIIGSTFWTKVGKAESHLVLTGMNDYRRIYIKSDDDEEEETTATKTTTTTTTNKVEDETTKEKEKNNVRLLNFDDTNRLHEAAVRFVSGALKFTPPGFKNIVLTHHAPLPSNPAKNQFTSHPRFIGQPQNTAFHSDQSTLISKESSALKAWIFGHTHHSCKFHYNQVLITSNQHGYLFEQTGFDINDFILLD
ncbi:hypothetical protein PPL_00246 [Heterostelium album PN500]|uniref:Calcineurin-like phosphoesterase domain-containing protein n=1 Tax=Heterostelium pallidum (strain ATCC 26659 / Pp 5 / PN500) TaxID=670386 RepID=D3AVY0_HETP5|nr:hypothetical protein PPL_00246 [Heterostelium album PN500]EFA86453.1 hypothetical protein PPL_00246 [Heterostelium album PN500]|eukprot:XP_020438558.1 hypothetical protein PPL_00246 [Heterostelium album PN500]